MNESQDFFRFQHRALGVLWAWGLGSIAAGVPMLLSHDQRIRQAGVQSIIWGAIDAALAWFGRRGARDKISSGANDGSLQARRFRMILLINAGLDAGYVAGGWVLLRGARGREQRVGTGLGIIMQGLFLLIYDSVLAWMVGRRVVRDA
ncbi:MAG: hypothetical protein ABIV47_10415 [Roseiflexaceae bacterium]